MRDKAEKKQREEKADEPPSPAIVDEANDPSLDFVIPEITDYHGNGAQNTFQTKNHHALKALWNDQIEKYFEHQPLFSGVYSADDIDEIPDDNKQGFIMNLSNHDEPGTHWVAVYITPDSIEYYDPLAAPPTSAFLEQIDTWIHKSHIPTMLKLKINRVRDQSLSTDFCGYHAIRFLDDRFHGIPYELTTRYSTRVVDDSKQGTKDITSEFELV
jgi:hypothetical protein